MASPRDPSYIKIEKEKIPDDPSFVAEDWNSILIDNLNLEGFNKFLDEKKIKYDIDDESYFKKDNTEYIHLTVKDITESNIAELNKYKDTLYEVTKDFADDAYNKLTEARSAFTNHKEKDEEYKKLLNQYILAREKYEKALKRASTPHIIPITTSWKPEEHSFQLIKGKISDIPVRKPDEFVELTEEERKNAISAIEQSPQVQRAVADSTTQQTVDSPEAKSKRDVEEKKLDTIKILSSVLIPTDKKLEFITLTTSNGIVYEDAKEIRPGFATLTSPNLKKLLDDLKAVKPVSYAAELTKQLQTLPDDKLTVVMAKFGEVGGAHNESVDTLKDSRKISYANQEAEIAKIKKDPEYKILFESKSGISSEEEVQFLFPFMNLLKKADSDAESLLRIAKNEADQQLLEIANEYEDKKNRAVKEVERAKEAKPFSQERFDKAEAALKQVIEEKKTLEYNADTLFTNLSKDQAMEKVKGHTDELSRVLQRSQKNAQALEKISNGYRDELLLKLKEKNRDDDKINYLLASKNALWDGGHIPEELADKIKGAITDKTEQFIQEDDGIDPPKFTLKIGLTTYNKYIDQLKQKIQDRTVIVEQLERIPEEDVKKKLLELYGKSEALSTNAVSKGDPAAQYLVAKFSSNVDQFHFESEFFKSFVRISIDFLTKQLKKLDPSYDKVPLLRNKGVDIQKQVDKLQKQIDEFTKIKNKNENELRDYFAKEYYLKASAQGYADAQYELASIYLLNHETNSGIKNYDNAIGLLDDAIAQGQPDAAKLKKQWQDSGVTDQTSWEQYWESKRPSTTYEKVVLHRDPTKLFGSPPASIPVKATTTPAAIAAVVSASSATAAAGATGALAATGATGATTSTGTSSPSGSVGAAGATTPNPTVSPGPDIVVKIGSETFVLSAQAPTADLGAPTVLLLNAYEKRFGTDATIKNTVAKYWKVSRILDNSISNPSVNEYRVPCGTNEIATLKTGFTSYLSFLNAELSKLETAKTDEKSAMTLQRDFVKLYVDKLGEPNDQKTCIKVQDTPLDVSVGSADGTVATTTSVNPSAVYYEVLPKLFALMYKNAQDPGPLDITQLFAKYGTTKEEIKALLEGLKVGAKPDTFKDIGQDGVHGMASAVIELYNLLPILFPNIYGHLATGVAGAAAGPVAGAPVAGAGTPPSGPATYDLIAKLQEIIDKFGFDDTTKASIITAFQEANTAYLTGKPEEAGPKIAAALTSIHTHVDTKMKAVLQIIEEISTMYLALQAARKTAIETLAKTPIPFPPTFVGSKATLNPLRKTLIEYIDKLPEPIKPLYSKMFANEEAFDGAIDALETKIKALPAPGSAPGGITLKPGETAVKTADLATLAQKVAEATAIMNEEPDEDKLNAELQRRLAEAIANLEAAELSTSTKRAALLERVGQAINIMNGEPDEDALNKAMADHLKAALEKIDQLENTAATPEVAAILAEKAGIQTRLDNALRLLSEAEKRRIIAPEKPDENNDNGPEAKGVSAGIAGLTSQGVGVSGSDELLRLRAEVDELKAKNTQLQIDLNACLAKQKQAGSSEEDKRTIESLTEQIARLSARQITETPGADQFLNFKQKIYKDVSNKLNAILYQLAQSPGLPDDFKDKLKGYQESMKGDNYKVSDNMSDQKDVDQFELAIGELIVLLPTLCQGKTNVNDLVETPYSSYDELLLGVFMEVKGYNNPNNKEVADLMTAKLKENNPGSTDEITEEDVVGIREKYKTKKESEKRQERNKLLVDLFRNVEGYKKKADGSPEKSDEDIAALMTTELQSDPTHSTETISVDDATLARYLYDNLQRTRVRGTDQFGSLNPMPKIASDKERRLVEDVSLYRQVTSELSSLVRAFNQKKFIPPEKQELARKLATVSPEDKKLERAFNRLGSKINGKNDKEIAGLMKEELKEDISVDQVEKARKLALETKTLIARLMTEKTKEPNKKTYTEDDVSRLRSIGETERIRLDTKFGRPRSASESSTESVPRPEIPAPVDPQSRLKPAAVSAAAPQPAPRPAPQPAPRPAPQPAPQPAASKPAESAAVPAPESASGPLPPPEVKEIKPFSETTETKKAEREVLQELVEKVPAAGVVQARQKTTIEKLKQLHFFRDFLKKANISDEDLITMGESTHTELSTISQFAKDKKFTYNKLSDLQKKRVDAYLYFIWAFLHNNATQEEKKRALDLIKSVKTKLDEFRGGAYTPTPLRGPEELPDILEEQDAWNKANDAYNNLDPTYKTLLPPPEPAPISSLATPFQNYINNEADPEALEEARDALGMVPPEDIEDYINNDEYENENNGNSVSERVAPMYQTALPRVKPEWVSIMIRADILQQLLQNKIPTVDGIRQI